MPRPILPASALPARPTPNHVSVNPLSKINLPVKKLLEIRRHLSIPVLLTATNAGMETDPGETTPTHTASVAGHQATGSVATGKQTAVVPTGKAPIPALHVKQNRGRRKGKTPVKYSTVMSNVSDSDSEDDNSEHGSLINCFNVQPVKMETNSDRSLQEVSVRFPNQTLAPAQQIEVPEFVGVSEQGGRQQLEVAPTAPRTNMSPSACMLPAPTLQTPVGTPELSTAASKSPIAAPQTQSSNMPTQQTEFNGTGHIPPFCTINNRQYMIVPIYGSDTTPLDLSPGKITRPQRVHTSNESSFGQGPKSICAAGTIIEHKILKGCEFRKSSRKGRRPSESLVKSCGDASPNTQAFGQADVSSIKLAQQEVQKSNSSVITTVPNAGVLSGAGQALRRLIPKTKWQLESFPGVSGETSDSQGPPEIQETPTLTPRAKKRCAKKKRDKKSQGEVAEILSVMDSSRSSLKANSPGSEVKDNDLGSLLSPVERGFQTRKYAFTFDSNGLTVKKNNGKLNEKYLIFDDCSFTPLGLETRQVTDELSQTQGSSDSEKGWQDFTNTINEAGEDRFGLKEKKPYQKNDMKEGSRDLGTTEILTDREEVAQILRLIDTVPVKKGYTPRRKIWREMTPHFSSPHSVKPNQISTSSMLGSPVLKPVLQPRMAVIKREPEDQTDRDLIGNILCNIPILDRLGPSGANRDKETVRTPGGDNAGYESPVNSSGNEYPAWKLSESRADICTDQFQSGTVSETSGDDTFSAKDTELRQRSEGQFRLRIRIKQEPFDPDDAKEQEGHVSDCFTAKASLNEESDEISKSNDESTIPGMISRKNLSFAASTRQKTFLPATGIQIKQEPMDPAEDSRSNRNIFSLFSAETQQGCRAVKSSPNLKSSLSDRESKPSRLSGRLKAPVLAHCVKSEKIETEDQMGRSDQGSKSLQAVSDDQGQAQSAPDKGNGETELALQRVIKTEPLSDDSPCEGITIEPVCSESDTTLNRMLFDFAASISASVQIPEIKEEPFDDGYEDSTTVDGVDDKMAGKSYLEVEPSEGFENMIPRKRILRKRKPSTVVPARKTRRKRTNYRVDKSKCAGYKCYCGQSFVCPAKLVIHRRVHTGEKPWKCPTCGKCFARRDVMKRHCNIHVNDRRFCCDRCPKRFLYLYELNRHRRTHTGEKRFECHLCGKRLSQMTGLKRHLDTHKGDKPYSCNICKKKFCRKSVLVKHMGRRHKNIRVLCPICAMGFRSKSAQIGHVASHSGTKRNQCVVCKAQFSGLYSLQRHMSTHCLSMQDQSR